MYYQYIRNDYPSYDTKEETYTILVRDELSSPDASTYSFQFTIEFTATEMFEVCKWCDENMKDDFLIGIINSGFENIEDAMAFKLRWL